MFHLSHIPNRMSIVQFKNNFKDNNIDHSLIFITGDNEKIRISGAVQAVIEGLTSGNLWLDKTSVNRCPTEHSIEIECKFYQDIMENIAIPRSFHTTLPHKKFILTEDDLPVCIGIALSVNDLPNIRPPENNEIYFAKIRDTAIIPSKKEEDAGYDIYADFPEDHFIIPANTTRLIPTGIACALHSDWYFQVEERGSTGSKGIKKSAGVVDSGYRGEIFIALTNCNNKTLVITKHPKRQDYLKDMPADLRQNGIITYPYDKAIAQLILHKVPRMQVRTVKYDDLLTIPSGRGTGSLGSSKK